MEASGEEGGRGLGRGNVVMTAQHVAEGQGRRTKQASKLKDDDDDDGVVSASWTPK